MPSTASCSCLSHRCGGKIVPKHVAAAHRRADLLARTVASQAQSQRAALKIVPTAKVDTGPVLRTIREDPLPLSPNVDFLDPPRTSTSPVEQEMLDHGFLTGEDLDIMTFGDALPNLGPNFHSPEALLATVGHFSAYNAATAAGARPLTSYEAHRPLSESDPTARQITRDDIENFTGQLEHQFSNDPTLLPDDHDDRAIDLTQEDVDVDAFEDDDDPQAESELITQDQEDDPDPFYCPDDFIAEERDLARQPPHILAIYAVTAWLHLQFHLPRVACQALLSIFALIILTLCPSISPPLVTLRSTNRALGLDKTIHSLPVCPSCREVFPPASSLHCQDTCTSCHVDLFLPSQTRRGNARANKLPVLNFPYLPLSEQIKDLLKIPGLEAVLDEWRTKDRKLGEYIDIFDGAVCRTKLKAPDGKLFFSNNADEKNGPGGELRIGVNLGVDW